MTGLHVGGGLDLKQRHLLLLALVARPDGDDGVLARVILVGRAPAEGGGAEELLDEGVKRGNAGAYEDAVCLDAWGC